MFQQIEIWIGDIVFQVQNFLNLGGDVLLVIALVYILIATLVVERVQYFYVRFPKQARSVRAYWDERDDHYSWQAHRIREALIGGTRRHAHANIRTVKTLVAILPLLGLMGTVTGMIAVFDVMAYAGMGSPRLMADGVAQATVPAMAGLVGAVLGVFAMYFLDWQARTRITLLADHLPTEHQHQD